MSNSTSRVLQRGESIGARRGSALIAIVGALAIALASAGGGRARAAEGPTQPSPKAGDKAAQAEPKKTGEARSGEKKKKEPRDGLDAVTVTREAKDTPWASQFAVYEETTDGHKLPITPERRFVDTRSDIVIERSMEQPEVIVSDNVYSKDGPDKLWVSVFVARGEARCRFKLAVDQLHYTSTDLVTENPSCPRTHEVGMLPLQIKKGDKYRLHSDQLLHGDELEIVVYGRDVGDVTTFDASASPPRVRFTSLKGAMSVFKATALDFQALRPHQRDVKRQLPIPIYGPKERVDIDRDVVVDFDRVKLAEEKVSPGFDIARLAVLRNQLEITAKATKEKTTRDVAVQDQGGFPTLAQAHDGELVTVSIARKATIDGKVVSVPLQNDTAFSATAVGLHYAPSGDRQAYYATATALAILGTSDGARPGFAQTFAYSFFVRTREPSAWDHLAFGFHFAVLGSDPPSEPKDPDENKPLSLGIGLQLTLGADIVHLGGGYDMLQKMPYGIIGLSVPDLINLFSSITKKGT